MTRWHVPLLALGLAFATPALAKKGDDDEGIIKTGIVSFDRVFNDVASIDRRLSNAQAMLGDARVNLNTALGLKEGTPLKKGFAELKERADGKVDLVMKGAIPTLEAKEAVPSDVTKGIDAVNGFTGNLVASLNDLAAVPGDARNLVQKTKTFPASLQKELQGGNLIDQLVAGPKVAKALTHNLGVTKALPTKADRVVGRMNSLQTTVVSEFTPAKRR
jgi:hypothetical protein